MNPGGTVLVVDDKASIVDAYVSYLRDRYTVRTAYSGREALESLDEEVDVVLLDRKMPGLSGDEVLEHIHDRDLTCRIALVTGVVPDVDIIDMNFDDYLLKPVSKEGLHRTVDALMNRARYGSKLQEYFALVSKRTVLERELSGQELPSGREFDDLCADIDRLSDDLDELLSKMDTEEAFRLIDR